jgi:hypothetical protein
MGFLNCDFLTEGGVFDPPICEATKKKITNRIASDICRKSSKYPECEHYKKQKGFCYITSAVCLDMGKPDDCRELTLFRKFRDQWLRQQANGEAEIQDYYRCAPGICEAIEKTERQKEIYNEIYNTYVLPCVSLIAENDFSSCYHLYTKMVSSLKIRFCGGQEECPTGFLRKGNGNK